MRLSIGVWLWLRRHRRDGMGEKWREKVGLEGGISERKRDGNTTRGMREEEKGESKGEGGKSQQERESDRVSVSEVSASASASASLSESERSQHPALLQRQTLKNIIL